MLIHLVLNIWVLKCKKYNRKNSTIIFKKASESQNGYIPYSTSIETNNTHNVEVKLILGGKIIKRGNYYDVFANNQHVIYYLEPGKIYVDRFPL